jgi:hypothetical protein
VQPELALLVQATDVHAAGMQVNPAVKWMRCVGAAPEVSSSS